MTSEILETESVSSTRPGVPNAAATPPAPVRLIRLTGLYVGVFLGTFAFNAASVALPMIQRDLHAGPAELELVVAAYGAALAALLIIGGRLGDRFGRRGMFTIGSVAFALVSVATACAPDIVWLIILRAAQGATAALMAPQVLATIQASTEGVRRARAVTIFGAVVGAAAAGGQVVGGILLGSDLFGLGWRAIFLVCAVIAALAAVTSLAAPRTRSDQPADTDVIGTVGLALGILAVILPLSLGPTLGWPIWTIVLLVAAPFILYALWRHQAAIERAGRVPLLPPSVLRMRALRLGLAMGALFMSGYGVLLYAYALAVQNGLGVGPLAAGLALGPYAIAFALTSVLIGRLIARFGVLTMLIGAVTQLVALAAIGVMVVLSWNTGSLIALQPALVVLGVGQAMMFAPVLQTVLRATPVSAAGLSGGIYTTVQQVALAIGTVVCGALFTPIGAAAGDGTAFAAMIAVMFVVGCAFLVSIGRLRRLV